MLEHLGATDARELVIAINDPDATVRATGAARRAAPDLRITVRTAFDNDKKRMEEAGTTYVVAAEAAAADAIIDQVLRSSDHSLGVQMGPLRTEVARADREGNSGTE